MPCLGALGLVLACAGGGCGGDDDGLLPDAGPVNELPGGCTVLPELITPVLFGTATRPPVPPGPKIRFVVPLSAGSTPDLLTIDLREGLGVFGDGIVPGSFVITGEESAPATCGLCVRVLGDHDPATDVAAQIYVARSGLVTLSSVEGRFTGAMQQVKLQSGQACTTLLPAAVFNDLLP